MNSGFLPSFILTTKLCAPNVLVLISSLKTLLFLLFPKQDIQIPLGGMSLRFIKYFFEKRKIDSLIREVVLIASTNTFLWLIRTFSSKVMTSSHTYSLPVSGSTVKGTVFPTHERKPFTRL